MLFLGVVVCSLLAVSAATDVQQCSGENFDLANNVQLSPCKKLPCRLRKGTDQHITITFKPEKDMDVLNNHVYAVIFGVELPFIGVDGANICDKLENEAGEKVSCPLKAGTTYVYRDSFPILSFYPNTDLTVHWSLRHNKKDITCFEVKAKITK
ncbi:ecdysteroid-regulated 16 kDa protein [Bicyclus anynana]|uniref:Ecdysteroid-regulated 16 kDa protein n=1 Tax=Bicyclus anynana TaxID=110368 RepID=A0A6J1MK58_BICAN|nr:ecdysteroid-regulated 16 kDa protein [Bicyclus anynana]